MSFLTRLPVFRTVAMLQGQLADSKAQVRTLRDRVGALKDDVERLGARDRTLNQLASPALDRRRLGHILKHEGRGYRTAEPFPHAVIDDFLDPALLERVADEFVAMDRTAWHRTSNLNERKLSTEDGDAFSPFTAKVITALNSGKFLTFLEQLSGIDGLIADPHLRGGGLHEIERGGKLGVHADFNVYERLKAYRRLNLLVYLNRSWKEEWGGHLELWNRDGIQKARSILPMFNRAVIFDTSNKSYHGHPTPLACPEGESRKSLALYYYTTEYPYQEDLTPHGTLFMPSADPRA